MITGNRYLRSMTISPDGGTIVTTNGGDEIEIWNVERAAVVRTLIGNGRAYSAIFSRDGTRLVTIGYNSDVMVWDTRTWTIAQRLPVRVISFKPIAISPDAKVIATINENNVVLLWDVATGKPIKELKGAAGPIWFLGFSNANRRDSLPGCPDRQDDQVSSD